MTIERKLNLLILLSLEHMTHHPEWEEYIYKDYNLEKMDKDLFNLLDEFLNDYALNTTEKSD